MSKIKYDVISSRTGKQEPFTGVFQNEEKAEEWYNEHGKKWESEGKKLVRIVCPTYPYKKKKR